MKIISLHKKLNAATRQYNCEQFHKKDHGNTDFIATMKAEKSVVRSKKIKIIKKKVVGIINMLIL